MRSEELLEIVQRRPFQSYRFTFTGGETFDLTKPEMMIVGRDLATLGRPSPGDERIADRVFSVALTDILKIELLTKAAKSRNGTKRK